jgi:hypothetical protein
MWVIVKKNANKILARKFKGKRPLGRLKERLEN